MTNEEYLSILKKNYENLRPLNISNNILSLSLNDKSFAVLLEHTNLSNINPNLFLLNVNEIFQTIYVLELLYKDSLTESQTTFIKQYTEKFMNLNNSYLSGSNDLANNVNALSIPIYSAYEPDVIDKPASSIIQEVINSHTEKELNGNSKSPRLVLTNPNFVKIEEENPMDNIANFTNAGFTTILLIGAAVVSACLYIAYFIIGK